jgi:hypothetical protein
MSVYHKQHTAVAVASIAAMFYSKKSMKYVRMLFIVLKIAHHGHQQAYKGCLM